MTTTEDAPPGPPEPAPGPLATPTASRKKAAKQPKFRYEADDLDGNTAKGEIQAADRQPRPQRAGGAAACGSGEITERKGLQTDITKQKVPLDEVMHFSRQMGTFLRAGVPMTEALTNLAHRRRHKRFRRCWRTCWSRCGTGARITDALAAARRGLPQLLHGDARRRRAHRPHGRGLRPVCTPISKRDIELSRAVRKALVYPMILLGLSVVVVGIIVVFAIPRFADLLRGVRRRRCRCPPAC